MPLPACSSPPTATRASGATCIRVVHDERAAGLKNAGLNRPRPAGLAMVSIMMPLARGPVRISRTVTNRTRSLVIFTESLEVLV